MQPETFQTRAGSSAEQHHNACAPNARTIIRAISVIVTAIATVAILVPATHRARAETTTTTAAVRSVAKFHVGWYDYLSGSGNLSGIRQEGMDAVMPYHDPTDVVAYLNKARETGVEVLLEIDKAVVKTGDPVAVAGWVARYKSHPAISGWYLADEPSINASLGYMQAPTLEKLYQAVKAEDPSRPVVVAFSTSDDMASFSNTYDIGMWDEYPCKKLQLEFTNMDVWRYRLEQRAAMASSKQGWIPVIQAFQLNNWRLPTANEVRYMTYASVQSGATGLFYWARYRSTTTWINNTLKPLTAEVRRLAPALAQGAVPNGSATSQGGPNVVSKTYRDPSTGKHFLVVVNHGSGRVDAKVSIASTLGVSSAKFGSTTQKIDQGILAAALQRYEARVYDLS